MPTQGLPSLYSDEVCFTYMIISIDIVLGIIDSGKAPPIPMFVLK